jgi:ssDNA-binding Zn-finger/Zn-ribbon topoisomerase 1
MNKEKTAYRGACPRCGKRVDMRIGREGTDSRFFTAQ